MKSAPCSVVWGCSQSTRSGLSSATSQGKSLVALTVDTIQLMGVAKRAGFFCKSLPCARVRGQFWKCLAAGSSPKRDQSFDVSVSLFKLRESSQAAFGAINFLVEISPFVKPLQITMWSIFSRVTLVLKDALTRRLPSSLTLFQRVSRVYDAER
jgi:hypothetical protein